MDRRDVARVLEETAAMLELSGANTFKVRAYENAAQAVLGMREDLEEAVRTRELRNVRGIGPTIFANIETLLATGRLPVYEELCAAYPPGLRECLRVPGLGVKKAKALHDALGVDSLEALEQACRDGRLAGLKGFGAKTAERIAKGIAVVRGAAGSYLYPAARARAEAILRALAATGLATRADVAGSLRRRREIVRDIDLIAASDRPEPLTEAFRRLPEVMDVIASGETKTSLRFVDGLAADLRIVSEEDYPACLLYFTGSQEHNTLLRGRARAMDLKLNEYGLFRMPGEERIAGASEERIYAALGLAFIEPELREGWGEIEAAERGTLPDLVTDSDIRGLIHVHTTESDGRDSLETMVAAARAAGYSYVAITDHSTAAAYAGGLTEERVLRQRDAIRALRREIGDMRIFHGTEADILADGAIDFGDAFLESFDLVVASVHSRFALSPEEQTRRLIRAVRNPRVAVLGHPTGRLLREREGVGADMEAVIDAAAESGCALEVNGSPHRLDLDWRLCRRAIERGALISVGPDAHSTREIENTGYAVGIARKGWVPKASVLNAKTADELADWLSRRRGSPIPELLDRAPAAAPPSG
jgi:DNA polymerase (family X)